MITKYWVGPKSNIDAKAGNTAGGFDSIGLHNCCVQYDRGTFAREAPNPTWALGPITEVIIKCHVADDMTVHYPNFVEKTLVEIMAYVADPDNHYEDQI